MKKLFFYLLTIFALISCVADQGKVSINLKRKKQEITAPSTIAGASVSSVQIINHQLVITGSGLDAVDNVVVDGQSFNESFLIESKTATKIIANSVKAFSFDISKLFNLILSDANASATFPIDFSLCNATLNGKGFNCSIAAQDKDVLSYDLATNKWKPRSINGLSYQGSWDATDPLPATTTAGDYFIVSVASAPYGVGDWIVWNGGNYDQINNSSTITSVFGRTNAIVATEGDYNLNLLTDVNIPTTPAVGKVLKFDGTHWVAGDDLSGGGAASVTSAEIANSAVTDAKIDTVSASKITGTLTSAQIADGAIVNADINAAAAIDYSKLNIPAGSIPYAKLNIANGDIPAAKISGLPAATSVLATTIVDADTTHAPDGNAVFDALGLKLNLTGGILSIGTISGVPTPTNSDDVANKGYTDTRDALKLAKAGDTMSGVLTLDSDLKIKGGANYVTVKGHATSATYNLVLPVNGGTNGYVLATDGSGNTSWVDVTSAVTNMDTDDVDEATNLYFTEARVLGTDLAGLNTGVNGPIAAADTVLGAMGKLQYQVTDLKAKGQWDKTVNDISYGAGNVEINTKLRLKDTGTNFVELKAPTTVTSTYTLTFPANDGNVNQVLRTDGAGVLTWVDITDSSVVAFARSALPTCAAGEVLKSNGTSFSCITDNSGAGAFSGTASKAVVTGAGGALDVSATSATEIGYVAGVTSAIQAQIDGKQATDATLTALAAYSTTGFMVQTAADTFAGRSIAGTANRLDITNGNGVSGNPTLNISTTLLPSPVGGDAGKFLKATGADASAWTALGLSDVTGALGFTPINKAGDSITSGTFTLSGTAVLRVPDPVAATDVANKQYVDGFGQWSKVGSDLYRLTGNVGVGTATPGVALDVVGTTSTTKLLVGDGAFNLPSVTFASDTGTGLSTNGSLRFSVAGGLKMSLSGTALDFNAGGAGPKIQQTGGNAALPSYAFNSDADTGMFNPNSSGGSNELGFSTAGVERIRIDPTGLVGVGTTTPKSKLDVNGAIRVGVDATACSATIAGAMRFNTPNVEFCNGTAWAAFGTSGATVASSQITDATIVDADISATANITATKLGTGAVDNTEFNYLDGVTSSIQTQLTSKQAADATLTALAGYNTNGILVQTAADTFVGRSIAGTANRVVVTNGDGVAANPTLNVSTALLPSPVVGDVGKYLKATAADTSVWTALSASDITTALTFTPINKAGDSITTGTITLSGTALLRTPDPVSLTDVANKQYVDGFGQWTKTGSDIYRSGGNVGIGTITPGSPLHISKNYTTTNATEEYGQYLATNFTVAATNWKVGLRLNTVPSLSTGTLEKVVGVQSLISSGTSGGTTTEAMAFWGRVDTTSGQILTNTYGVMIEEAGGTGNTVNQYGLYVKNLTKGSTQNYALFTDGTTKSYFGGNVGLGYTSPSEKLEVSGNVKATSYLYTSDRRLKDNIKTIDDSLAKILSLRGVEFDWKKTGAHEIGLIAQEVEAVEPNLVATSTVDGMKSVKYGNIVALLIEAMKAEHQILEDNKKTFALMQSGLKKLDQRTTKLEREVASLKEENAVLKNELDKIKKHLKLK